MSSGNSQGVFGVLLIGVALVAAYLLITGQLQKFFTTLAAGSSTATSPTTGATTTTPNAQFVAPSSSNAIATNANNQVSQELLNALTLQPQTAVQIGPTIQAANLLNQNPSTGGLVTVPQYINQPAASYGLLTQLGG